jgi:glycosyltransferase involved in cell wall biosynthesis
LKVIHLNITEKYGGAAKAANRLHKELIKSGVDSKILVLKKETKDATIIEASSLYSTPVKLRLFCRKILNRIKQFLINPKYGFNNKTLLFNILKKLDFDILHLHWVTGGYVNLGEFKNLNKQIVWTMHDCAAFTGICHVIGSCEKFVTQCGKCPQIGSSNQKDVSNREFQRKLRIYRKTRLHFVSPSNWLALTCSKSPLLKDKGITIIPHGLDLEIFTPIDKIAAKGALLINSDAKVILCGAVTLDDDNKGMNLFSQTLLYMQKLFLRDEIQIIFFGEGGIVKEDNFFNTFFLDYISDEKLLRIYYSAADVVVIPSKQESFGQVTLEAMACGTPVVAFRATGSLDIIDHLKNGYLANPYEPNDLALGIKWCLDNNQENVLSKNALEKVLSSFRIGASAKKYLELYTRLLSVE